MGQIWIRASDAIVRKGVEMVKEYPESLITAFLTSYKPVDVMRSAGISKSKYYSLKADPDFQRVLTERRTEIVKSAVLKMESYLTEDVERLQEIIRDPETKDQIKVNAIQLLMSQLGQWKNTTEILERLQALEDYQRKNQTV